MFKSIGSLAIYVTDLEKAKKFYTEILGFEVSADLGPTLCFLKSGDFHVYLKGGNKPSSVDNQTCRLSFFLRAQASASETFIALKSAGVKLLQGTPELVGNNTLCFQFEDPDGNIIEVAASPSPGRDIS